MTDLELADFIDEKLTFFRVSHDKVRFRGHDLAKLRVMKIILMLKEEIVGVASCGNCEDFAHLRRPVHDTASAVILLYNVCWLSARPAKAECLGRIGDCQVLLVACKRKLLLSSLLFPFVPISLL